MVVIASEVAASSTDARARRAIAKASRVRGSSSR
jgi:hypothetical protein